MKNTYKDVVVKGSNSNTVTIIRSPKSSHNRGQAYNSRQIVVNCFSDADLEHLRKITIPSSIQGKKSRKWAYILSVLFPNLNKYFKIHTHSKAIAVKEIRDL